MAKQAKKGLRQGDQLSRREQEERKQETLTAKTPSIAEGIDRAIVMKDQDLFFVTGPDGSVPIADRRHHGFGVYHHDCRFLNGYELTIDDHELITLGAAVPGGFQSELRLTSRPERGNISRDQLGVCWDRMIDDEDLAIYEVLTLKNHGMTEAAFRLRLRFSADFEDLHAIRGLFRQQHGERHPPAWHGQVLGFRYEGLDGLHRSLAITFSPAPDGQGDCEATFDVSLGPQEERQIQIALAVRESQRQEDARPKAMSAPALDKLRKRLLDRAEDWVGRCLHVDSDSELLDRVTERSFRDLYALRMDLQGHNFFAAGVPWFTTLFGRDSLLAAWQVLPFDGETTAETLKLLAKLQGTRDDYWRDEAPGKILHELRMGELANMGAIPHTPYYGTVDATLLYLITLAEYVRWKGDWAIVETLRPAIERALFWMERYEDGYFTYDSAVAERLVNQGWKDSGDAIVNRDGSLATPPIALVEVQGYAYLAWLATAELFAAMGEDQRARGLVERAERLKERFNRDFWLDGLGTYAMALQGDGSPCAVVSSNPGHALWTGIVEPDKAARVVERLMAEDMFSGWGVRTLSTEEVAYNPVGYHLGTVWPHDNAIIARGFRRYGFDEAAGRLWEGIFSAATHFDGYQLPELFSGFPREPYSKPISYPVACHPQAWAAGAIPSMLATLLGLEGDAGGKRLEIIRPMLPEVVDFLDVRHVRVGEAWVDLRFKRTASERPEVEVLDRHGELEVVVLDGKEEA